MTTLSKLSNRTWYLLAALCCASLLAFALYKQHQDFLDPCPLCIIQRVAFMWVGAWALLGFLHNPGRSGQRFYNWLLITGCLFGAGVAGRHVWMQNLPPDLVPECGPGLNYMLENFPLTEVLSNVFFGSGSCAEVHWTFMGMSMPAWTLAWYVGLGVVTLWFVFRRAP